jgi:hypothetical protein
LITVWIASSVKVMLLLVRPVPSVAFGERNFFAISIFSW